MGPPPENGHRISDFYSGLMQAAQHAGQRFGHGRIFESYVRGDHEHVGFNDATWHANVFGVSAIVEQEILAKVLLMLGAVEAHLAGCGIECDNAHALLKAVDALTDFFDHSSQFMRQNKAGGTIMRA